MIRHALEIFFRRVLDLYNSGHIGLKEAVSKVKNSSDFQKNATSLYPKMSVMNHFLTHDSVWKAVLVAFDTPFDVELPNLEGHLIYGLVSNEIHHSDLVQVIVSNKADEKMKGFVKFLGILLDKNYTEFEEEITAKGEETEGNL